MKNYNAKSVWQQFDFKIWWSDTKKTNAGKWKNKQLWKEKLLIVLWINNVVKNEAVEPYKTFMFMTLGCLLTFLEKNPNIVDFFSI